jgi:hypothetical protein
VCESGRGGRICSGWEGGFGNCGWWFWYLSVRPFLRLFFLARLLCEAEDGDVAAASRRVSRLLRSHELRELPARHVVPSSPLRFHLLRSLSIPF